MDKLEIYNQLKEEIIDLKIEPGALISENEISRRFEVSRTPVRDVFLRLSTMACWKSYRTGEQRCRID